MSAVGLEAVLGALAPEAFLERCFDRAPHLARGAADAGLFSVEGFERLVRGPALLTTCELQARRADAAEIRIVSSPADAAEALSRGFTLHVSTLENALDGDHAVLRLADTIGAWLGAPLRGVSAFLSPEAGAGLPRHIDDEDIFTIQVEGEKTWRLFGRRAPGASPSVAGPVDGDLLESEVTLRPGDALYLPRRVPHEVACARGPSLSLGLAFRAPTLGEVLLRALGARAAADPALAAALGPGPAQGSAARRALGRLIEDLDDAAVEAAARASRASRRRPPPPSAQTFGSALRADRLTADDAVEVVAPDRLAFEDQGARVLLRHGDGDALVAPAKAGSALAALVGRAGPFTAHDLPGPLDVVGRLCLLRKAARLGLVRVLG